MASPRSSGRLEPPKPKAVFALKPNTWYGQSRDEVLKKRKAHLSAGQYHFYKEPLLLVEAKMQYCFDEKGQQYVDGYSNVCHVGHCHPHFVAQTQKAMEDIISNTRYLHPGIGNYAERLKSKLPPSLCVCYFVNSGSEANDLAMRLARGYTSKKGIICLENAYHGTTMSCTGVSTSLSTGTTKGAMDYKYCSRDVHVVPVPDTYRGKYRADDPHAGKKYADHVKQCCDEANNDIAAFIHESVQGVGGQIVYPIDYLKRAYANVRKSGGVVIADEVQTGFGRCGTHFWAFEAQGVVPDIVVLGKPIGNGFPLGAVVCRREIAEAFDGVQYFNTNGGNPVACAAGMAVLDIIDADGLQRNALDMSLALMPKLEELKKRHSIIGDVRGVGLFVGIELVRDHDTLEPAVEETAEVMERCRSNGLLVGKGGQMNNVIRMKPPLCISRDDIDFIVSTLDAVLGEVQRFHSEKAKAGDATPSGYGDGEFPVSYRPTKAQGAEGRASTVSGRAFGSCISRAGDRRAHSDDSSDSSDDESAPRAPVRRSHRQEAPRTSGARGSVGGVLGELVERSLRASSPHREPRVSSSGKRDSRRSGRSYQLS